MIIEERRLVYVLHTFSGMRMGNETRVKKNRSENLTRET